MSEPNFPIIRLKVRPDFLAAAKGKSCAKGAIVMQARARQDDEPTVRVGFTATKKIGGSVVRNRAKRRMRAAAQQLVPLFGRPGQDYVLIARNGAPTRPWGRLLDDVKSALLSLRAESQSPVSAKHRAPPPSI